MWQKVIDSGHVLSTPAFRTLADAPPRVTCVTCGSTTARGRLYTWLAGGPCPGEPLIPQAALWPERIPCTLPGIHRSHTLRHHRGLWWCIHCGAYCSLGRGRSSPRRLVEACVGPERRTQAGAQQLARLAKGLPPTAAVQWPNPLGTVLSNTMVLPLRRLMNKTTLTPAAAEAFPSAATASSSSDVVVPMPVEPVTDDYDENELGLALPLGMDTDSDMD